ncbi:MAG: hypothetical protein WAU71_15680 [Pyrinomonadaceae bacterium]
MLIRSATSILVAVLLAASVSSQAGSYSQPVKPFVSDSCSWFPDGNWADCCYEHDKEYWIGGANSVRKAADKRLKQCVREKNKGWKGRWLSNAMYMGVRLGGVHWLPLPFRWGFGNKWPKKQPEKPTRQTNK